MDVSKEILKNLQIDLSDEMLEFLIKLTENKIKNFCNVEEVPEELKETQIQMCKDLYDLRYKNSNSSNNDGGETIEMSGIKNIKRGDAQFEFTSETEKIENEKNFIKELINSDSFLFNYENELYDFRRFRW